MRRAPWLLTLLVLPLSAALPLAEDDAGSGRDAPDGLADGLPIVPGVAYQANISSTRDAGDAYAFHAAAGDVASVRVSGALGCVEVRDGAQPPLARVCTSGGQEETLIVVLPSAGAWLLRYDARVPQSYVFSLGRNAAAPPVLPLTLDPAPESGRRADVRPARQEGPHAVVAVVDTGVNPYHAFLAAPALVDPPASWLPQSPNASQPLHLSLAAPDPASALALDAADLSAVRRSSYDAATDSFDAHLYHVPGTRIVGAVSFGEWGSALDPPGTVPLVDEKGHGAMAAGLALGADLDVAEGDVLLVVVEVSPATIADGIRWAARQPWIDAISVSIATAANAPVTASPFGDRLGYEWATLEAASRGKAVFVASNNGASGTSVPPDHCTTYTGALTGPAWVTRVGAADPASGDATWWHCVPVEVVGRTSVLAPAHDHRTDRVVFTGTSAATPNVAGHAMTLLLDARRANLTVDARTATQHLLNASAPGPDAPGVGRDPPLGPASYLDEGYGLVDAAALDRARLTLLSGAAPAPRGELDAWVARDAAVRRAMWGPGSLTAQ